MPTDDTTPAERFRTALKAIVSDVHVSGPGIVQGVSGEHPNMRIKAQPMIARIDSDGNAHPYSPINDVPLQTIGLGGWSIEFTPGPGDLVWLVFSDRPLDEWKGRKENVEPRAKRGHAVQDAVAFPWAGGSGTSDSMTIKHESGSPAIELTLTGATVTGNLDVTGILRVGTSSAPITVNTHIHPVGDPNTGPPNVG